MQASRDPIFVTVGARPYVGIPHNVFRLPMVTFLIVLFPLALPKHQNLAPRNRYSQFLHHVKMSSDGYPLEGSGSTNGSRSSPNFPPAICHLYKPETKLLASPRAHRVYVKMPDQKST